MVAIAAASASSDTAWQVVASLGSAAAAVFAVIGIIVTARQNRKALATARDQLEQSKTQEREQRKADEQQLRTEVDGQRAQVALQRASDLRARLLAETGGLYNLADIYVIDQALASFAAEVGSYLRTVAISDNRTVDSLIDDDRLSFIIAAAWARDPVARSYISEVRHAVTISDGFGGELRFAAPVAGIVSNIVNQFQARLLKILNDNTQGPQLRSILKGNSPQGNELSATGAISDLLAAQLQKAAPCLQQVREVLTFAQSLLSTQDDESILAAALATVTIRPQATHIDDLRSSLVPLAKRLDGDLGATRASESIDALQDALTTYSS